MQKFCARYKNGEGNFRTFPTLPQVSLVHKFSPQMMSYHSFSSDFIRDEPWVSEHIISDTDLEPVALLYQSCLGRPFITDAVCKIGNAEILVTGAFGAALKKIEAVWAKQENADEPLEAVDLIGKSRTGVPSLRSRPSTLTFA